MKRKLFKLILSTGFLVGLFNSIYSSLLQLLGAYPDLMMVLGYSSIVVLPIGIYIGLRRARFTLSKPLSFWQSIAFGMIISLAAAVTIILSRAVIEVVWYEVTFSEYFLSRSRINTLKWYSMFGLAYCILIHFIIKFQFRSR